MKQYMTFNEFKLHMGKWGFLSVEVPNEQLLKITPKGLAPQLLKTFTQQAQERGMILVKDSMHAYNQYDKQVFGFDVKPDHTAFIIYTVPK